MSWLIGKQVSVKDKLRDIEPKLAGRMSFNSKFISGLVAELEPDFIVISQSGVNKVEDGNFEQKIPEGSCGVFYLDLYWKTNGKYQGMIAFLYNPFEPLHDPKMPGSNYLLRFVHHI